MVSVSRCVPMLALVPIALTACAEIEAATGSWTPTAPLVGVDLGGSGRVPQIAGRAGEGEGDGRTEPNPPPAADGSMTGMTHGSTDHGSMPMDHGSMDHGSMGRSSTQRSSERSSEMAHGSMTGMRHRSSEKMAAAHETMPGTRHEPTGAQLAHSGHAHVQATGTVNSVDAASRKVNVTHAPIPTIGLPSMTMDFPVAPSVDLNAVKPGARVRFEMEQGQGGMYVIQSIAPAIRGQQ